MALNPSMVNLLSVPLRASVRKRSGSFSEALSAARSLSTERPGTPRPAEVESLGHVDSSTCGFRKPLRKDNQFFGSLDSLSIKNGAGGTECHTIPSIKTEMIKRAYSTEAMELSRDSHTAKVSQLAATLGKEEMMKMSFYSKFTPTSVSLSHFLDHGSGGGTVEDSFLFLRREIPVRLANMMMELEVRFS